MYNPLSSLCGSNIVSLDCMAIEIRETEIPVFTKTWSKFSNVSRL
jgi:hypothetical protein